MQRSKHLEPVAQRSTVSARVLMALGGFIAVAGLLMGCQQSSNPAPQAKELKSESAGLTAELQQANPSSPPESRGSQYAGSATRSSADSAETVSPVVPSTGVVRQQGQMLSSLLDPNSTGWQTEAFNEAAGKQLKLLAHLIEQPSAIDHKSLAKFLAEAFSCQSLKPDETDSKLTDAALVVEQAGSEHRSEARLKGTEGLLKAIQSLPRPVNDYHVKFKIVGVKPSASSVETPVYVEGGGVTEAGRVQWRANWNCTWSIAGNLAPKLRSIAVLNYEQVLSPARVQPWFVDDTRSVLGDEPSFQSQLVQSTDYWIQRVEGRLGISRLGHHGLTVGDVNGDGRDDLYVCQPGGLPNRLYQTQPDGTAQDIASSANVDYLEDSTCSLLVDLDNDGDQDLVVVTVAGAVVLSNDGKANFKPEAFLPECRNAFSLTAADYDGDRLPDLYVGRYWPDNTTRGEIAIPVPYYDAHNGGRNMMLRNTGNWKFADVTAQVGLDHSNTRFTMAAAWEDIDEDGDSDLYVANDFGRNCLYRNDAGKFTNMAASAGVEDIASGMSVSFADYDHNGQSDIYVSNMFSSAGNRITYQRKYGDKFTGESLAKVQRMARGNTLFKNQGDLKFDDVSVPAAVTMGRWAWGSLFADINNDSWEDLVVLNGFISTADTGDL